MIVDVLALMVFIAAIILVRYAKAVKKIGDETFYLGMKAYDDAKKMYAEDAELLAKNTAIYEEGIKHYRFILWALKEHNGRY